MSSEEEKNMALVRRFWESVARGDLDAIDELLAPDFVDHSLLAGQVPGREGYKQQVAEQHAALSDIRPIIEDQLAQGDKVVTRLTWRSDPRSRGVLWRRCRPDKEVVVTAMSMHRIVGGKIAEEWSADNGTAEASWSSVSSKRYASASAWSRSLGWPEASSKPRSPRRCPNWRAGRSLPTTSPPGRWEETSTTSIYLSEGRLGLVVGDATGKGVPAALVMSTTCGMLQRSQPRAPPRPGRCSQRVNEALLSRHPIQHVRHLLLRHPRPQERTP